MQNTISEHSGEAFQSLITENQVVIPKNTGCAWGIFTSINKNTPTLYVIPDALPVFLLFSFPKRLGTEKCLIPGKQTVLPKKFHSTVYDSLGILEWSQVSTYLERHFANYVKINTTLLMWLVGPVKAMTNRPYRPSQMNPWKKSQPPGWTSVTCAIPTVPIAVLSGTQPDLTCSQCHLWLQLRHRW